MFDAENSSNNIVNHHQADQQEQLTEQTHNSVESENTIEEAGEVTNVSYVVPPLTLLNQPAKQKQHLKLKCNVRTSTREYIKRFWGKCKSDTN